MSQVVVVVHSMTVAKMPVKWLGVVEGNFGRAVTSLGSLASFIRLEYSSSGHDTHDIVWLLHAPHMIFHIVESSTKCFNRANLLGSESIIHGRPGHESWPVAALLDECSGVDALLVQGNDCLEHTKARVENIVVACIEIALEHVKQQSTSLTMECIFFKKTFEKSR